jgi:phage gp36-like protein
MAVTLNYVTLAEFGDVMTQTEQAEATDDSYGQGGTISSSGPTRDEDMVRRFLKRGEGMADSYLIHYSRPVGSPPQTLKYVVMVIARYFLNERGDGAVGEDVQKSYNQAMRWLRDIRDGKIDLGGDVGEQGETYFGERTGGVFSGDSQPFNDESTFATGQPY